MKLIRDKRTRIIVLIMLAVVIVSLLGAHLYYSRLNSKVDPRIRPARELYEEYNKLAAAGDFIAVIQLLDSVEKIYSEIPHYLNSFETGVLANNRAAVYLTVVLHRDSLSPDQNILADIPGDSLVAIAEKEVNTALSVYKNWKMKYADSDRADWRKMIRNDFVSGLEEYPEVEQEKFLEKRLDEFEATRTEIDRRLSVGYTNLGMICRYNGNYDSALVNYTRAMKL
ncbi:MAG: tetratricopeptide repeat protein, partial [Bacteroidales bacterium]|nr:tetratricopeptide repeat protein [Bacteroidales bacterium]